MDGFVTHGIQALNVTGAFETSQMVAGDGGVNVAITGLTGGSVNLEVNVAGRWVAFPNLVFTVDGLYHVLSACGRQCRLVGVGATGTIIAEVLPVGRH